MLWILYNCIKKISTCDSRMSGVVSQTNKCEDPVLSFSQIFNASKYSAYTVAIYQFLSNCKGMVCCRCLSSLVFTCVRWVASYIMTINLTGICKLNLLYIDIAMLSMFCCRISLVYRLLLTYILPVSGASIRKLTNVPITDILAVVIFDVDTDTDIKQ